jgi:hypothetical protein
MSDDPATQSLGINKLTLWERRQRYKDWLASGRRANRSMGVQTRTDEPSPTELATKRAQAEAEAASHLLNPLPPGAVVRTDKGDEKVNLSDDVRLDLAKALLPKIESSDPAMAERIDECSHLLAGTGSSQGRRCQGQRRRCR